MQVTDISCGVVYKATLASKYKALSCSEATVTCDKVVKCRDSDRFTLTNEGVGGCLDLRVLLTRPFLRLTPLSPTRIQGRGACKSCYYG